MRSILILVAMGFFSGATASTASAQMYNDGYGFALGANYAFPVIGRSYLDRDDLPYFAKFPPVYYSHIVRRPYGVSPYAAPPGITPVEMTVTPMLDPQVISNPYFETKPTTDGGSVGESKPLLRSDAPAQDSIIEKENAPAAAPSPEAPAKAKAPNATPKNKAKKKK